MGKSEAVDKSTIFVIFGASGDLTKRKLIPALFNQSIKGRLPENFQVVGFARRPYDHDAFRAQMLEGMKKLADRVPNEKQWEDFSQHLWYVQGDLKKPGDFESLRSFVEQLAGGPSDRLYYLATAPSFFPVVIQHLGRLDMAKEDDGWRRVVIEKPFGHDLDSAMRLNQAVHADFKEHQVYRIDHYLGKETAQNILYFRFLNTIFEPVWNRNYIDHVQITVAESMDVGQVIVRATMIRPASYGT